MEKTILLIEDNDAMRENTSEILGLSDYKVITASNGKTGVELARKHKPDLIICDIMMPELDGYGVLHMLGKSDETAGIPFIFLTAKAEKTDFRKGMAMGADDYLTKPFDDIELLNAVELRLKKANLAQKRFQPTVDGVESLVNEVKELQDKSILTNERTIRKFRKKEMIFTEGNHPSNLYLIHSGMVKTFKTNESGKEFITGVHNAGEFLGYVALLEGEIYNESAEILEEAEIYIIPKQDFFTLIHNNKEVSGTFVKMLSNNLAEHENRLIKLAYNSVRKRVAEALVMLADKYQKEGVDPVVLPVSRENLAGIVGTATESVIRTLGDFKEEELISVKKGDIYILNLEKLKHMKN